jgi:hypothetical protein
VLAPLATAWLTGGLPGDGCSAQRKPACLAIRFLVGCALIIQTIGLDLSGAVWTEEASNVSRLDPSGAMQGDAEHPTRNRKAKGSNRPRAQPKVRTVAFTDSDLLWDDLLS